MPPSARLFVCARCRSQVVLCRRCDRGQIYCGAACSAASRVERQREAARRHARSFRARLANAARQAASRARRASRNTTEVTDQGSDAEPVRAPSANAPDTAVEGGTDRIVPVEPPLRCRRCRCVCDPFLRLGFLPAPMRGSRARAPPAEESDR